MITGVGKSSLVNAIFEQDISQVGRGVPITKHITKYEKSDLPVTLYDTVVRICGRYRSHDPLGDYI